jgi:hypothetical protein
MADPSHSNRQFHYVGPGKQFVVPREHPDPNLEDEDDPMRDDDDDNDDDEDDGDKDGEEEEEGDDDDDEAEEEEEEEEFDDEMLVTNTNPSATKGKDHSLGDDDESDWRLRDAAHQMIQERQKIHAVVSSSNKKDSPSSMRFSNQWSEKIASIQNHPELYNPNDVVGQAFTAAATAVLQALMLQTSTQPSTPNYLDQEMLACSTSILQVEDSKSLLRPPRIHVLRNSCMERAYENKEYTKRRGGKTDVITNSHTKMTTPKIKIAATGAKTQEKKEVHQSTSGIVVESKKLIPSPPATASSSQEVVKAEESESSGDEHDNKSKMSSVPSPEPVGNSGTVLVRKCTRNTPASTSSALDGRWQQQRAILRAAGNLVFGMRPEEHNGESMTSDAAAAQVLAREIRALMRNSFQRSDARYRFRHQNQTRQVLEAAPPFMECWDTRPLFSHDRNRLENNHLIGPPDTTAQLSSSSSTTSSDSDKEECHSVGFSSSYLPDYSSLTMFWQENCLQRCLEIMKSQAHMIFHDLQWRSRHGRVANILRHASNTGPHLILTTKPEKGKFAREFAPFDPAAPWRNWIPDSDEDETPSSSSSSPPTELRALIYQGSKARRCQLREYFAGLVNGTSSSSPFHVLIVSYQDFLGVASDYLHLCQIPWQVVIVDDGAAWMAAAWDQTSTSLAMLWQTAIFARNDHQTGFAGAVQHSSGKKEWDFQWDTDGEGIIPDDIAREACVGLTARHRVLTAATFALPSSSTRSTSTELIHVGPMLEFVAPYFMEVVREEWDRCKITSDLQSMNHFRKCVARSVVVHHPDAQNTILDMNTLALQAMTGKLQPPDRSGEQAVPSIIPDDEFVASGKIAYSRRSSLQWLGSLRQSWLRYELGSANLQPIQDVMKSSNYHAYFCEEITTASSTTATGANGQVAGSMAYRLAVRCGRHFGSEQGLRQHIAAMHAPPGTWLCRTCSTDCVTNQARTHHERVCGVAIVPTVTVDGPSGEKVLSSVVGAVGAAPIVGQGGKKRGVGKKKANHPLAAAVKSPTFSMSTAITDKDPDGSLRVHGYRGVWVNKVGKHFVKIDGKRLTENETSEKILLFEDADEAAQKYDDILQKKCKDSSKLELNFQPDGSRIVYETVTSPSQSGLGGSTANVVPALSIINIKARDCRLCGSIYLLSF